MPVSAIDEDSPLLQAVKQLWRAHSDNLGYLPEGGFLAYARDRKILVATDENGTFCGYLLYRIARQRAVIVQFCVVKHLRQKGWARCLMRELVTRTKKYRGILLSCRRDFDEANKSWPRLGFHPISDKPGRAAAGSELAVWAIDHGHKDLCCVESGETIAAAVDRNIILDIVLKRNEESLALSADWLSRYVTLYYTAEQLTEINKLRDKSAREQAKRELRDFQKLVSPGEAFFGAEETLKPLFPNWKNHRDESDFRQIVHAHAGKADVFVTRDADVLNRSDDIYATCGLHILRPAELCTHIDTLLNEKDYQVQRVAGTNQIRDTRLTAISDELAVSIRHHAERQGDLVLALNRYLATPAQSECHEISDRNGQTLASYVIEREAGLLRVPYLRIVSKWQEGSLARVVLTLLSRKAIDEQSSAVFITDSLPPVIEEASGQHGFLPVRGGRLKLLLRGVQRLQDIVSLLTWNDESIEQLKAVIPLAREDVQAASMLEHILWPAKLIDSVLPSFLVPIKREYAQHLFDEKLAQQSLLGVDQELALNSESAYYRSARPRVLTFPSRVLWYVSSDDDYRGTQSIRGCARIIELAIGKPKDLFRRFRRFGVYRWPDVFGTAKRDLDKDIMAFRFDDREMLPALHWNSFQPILAEHNGSRNQITGPVKLTPQAFERLYVTSLDSAKVRSANSGRNKVD